MKVKTVSPQSMTGHKVRLYRFRLLLSPL